MTVYRFEEIAHNINDKKMPVPGDEKTYIGLEHLDTGSLQVTRWGQDVVLTGEKLVMKKGDVLFGRRNTYLRRAAIAPHDGIFSAHGMIFRPKTDVIDAEFFPFFISSDYFIDEAIKISVGSLSPTVNWGTLKKLEFDLPSMEEQKRLAKILMAAEETRQAYKKLIKQTDELVKAKFEEMFGTLKRERLGNYIEQIRGVSYKPSDLNSTLTDDYVTLLRANNINDGIINFDDVQYVHRNRVVEKQFIKPNDILVCASSGSLEHVGKSALCMFKGEYTFGAFCKLIRATGELKPEYIASYMQTDEYRTIIKTVVNGANINNLRNEHIDDILVPVPTEAQQQQFIAFLQQAERTKLATQQSLDALNETVRALVNRNFN